MEGALEYTRKPKTEEKMHPKPQNRKPHTKLYTQIGKKNRETKIHIGYQNRKTAGIFYENRKPDAKKRKIRKPH